MKIIVLVLVWLVVFIAAFAVPRFIEPTGSGFTRGMNRLPALAGLHCLGLILALGSAGLAFRTRVEIAKWLVVTGFVPLAVDLLLIGFIVMTHIAAMVGHP